MTEQKLVERFGFTGKEASDEATAQGIDAFMADNPRLAAGVDLWARGQILQYKILFFVGSTPAGAAAISALIASTTGAVIPPAAIMAAAQVGKDVTLKVDEAYKARNGDDSSANASPDGQRRDKVQATATQGGERRNVAPTGPSSTKLLIGGLILGVVVYGVAKR